MALRHLDPLISVDWLAAVVDASPLGHLTDEARLRPATWRRAWDRINEVSDELQKRHERPPEADERSFRPVLDPDAVVTLGELSDAELLDRLENDLMGVGDIQYRYGMLLGLSIGAELRSAVNESRDSLSLSTLLGCVLDVVDAMNTDHAMQELGREERLRRWRETGTTPMLEWLREQCQPGQDGEATAVLTPLQRSAGRGRLRVAPSFASQVTCWASWKMRAM